MGVGLFGAQLALSKWSLARHFVSPETGGYGSGFIQQCPNFLQITR